MELDHWCIMVRPAQPVLGALVLACKQPVTAFSDIDEDGFRELQIATKTIETMLKAAVDYEKINYLMLMMVDPHVHFHVLPRYSGTRAWQGIQMDDDGWPGQPDLGKAVKLTSDQQTDMVAFLRSHSST
ncbi:MAG: HIT family protein [Hyphomicrobiales bacterium]